MEAEFSKGRIIFKRQLSKLDRFVIDFVSMMKSYGIRYVIISGYVSILFGRSRATEDIDVFVENMSKSEFNGLMAALKKGGMWALNSEDDNELFSMLKDGLAIRIAERGKVIPNFELKFPQKEDDFISINNPLKVIINGNELNISSLEMQIAYKLYLGSEKDIEDAVYVYNLFKERLDKELLTRLVRKLSVEKMADQHGIK